MLLFTLAKTDDRRIIQKIPQSKMQPTSSNECMELEGIQENLYHVSLCEFSLYNKKKYCPWPETAHPNWLFQFLERSLLPPLVYLLS